MSRDALGSWYEFVGVEMFFTFLFFFSYIMDKIEEYLLLLHTFLCSGHFDGVGFCILITSFGFRLCICSRFLKILCKPRTSYNSVPLPFAVEIWSG